jgi:hypothetical protein
VQFPEWLENLSVSELDEKTSWWACSWCLAFADYRAPKKRQECRFYVNILKFIRFHSLLLCFRRCWYRTGPADLDGVAKSLGIFSYNMMRGSMS